MICLFITNFFVVFIIFIIFRWRYRIYFFVFFICLVADLISTNRVMTMMIAIMIPMINIFDYYDN